MDERFKAEAFVGDNDRVSARVTVRDVLRVREFRAVLASSGLSILGDQVARIAVALLVFDRTGSEFAASATYACSYLTWLVSGPLLSSLADRQRRRRLMVRCDLLRAGLIAVLLVPGLPLWILFAVLVLVGLLSPPFDAAKSALLPEILAGDLYVAGSAVQSAVFQGAHVGGFLVGGTLVAFTSAQVALAVDVATFLVSAALLGIWVAERPVTRVERPSLARDTVAGVSLVAADPVLRRLLAYGVVGSLTMIVPEGLAVPVSERLGGGAMTAGVLTAAIPAGYLVGSFCLLRVPVERRPPLLPRLTLLACLPLLLTPVVGSTAAVVALWVLAGAACAVGLVANAAFMVAVPSEVRGRAFGVAQTTLMAVQGVVLLAVGALAELVTPLRAVGLAGAVILVPALLLALRPQVRREGTTGAVPVGGA